MFFGKKSNSKETSCNRCKNRVNKEYSFCPRCGLPMTDPIKEQKEFGMLGKHDLTEDELMRNMPIDNNLGMVDKMVGSLMTNLMKSLDKQMRQIEKENGQPVNPQGIRIEIGIPQGKRPRKSGMPSNPSRKDITEEQIQRMISLPRKQAKTNIRRLSDKVIYELTAPGINSPEDIFVSKLETGYEIKAIGEKSVYVNSLPVELPMKGFAIKDDKLLVEFKIQE